MYLSHYNLSSLPFQISTDPRFLYLSNDHREALANLRYGLQAGNGYVVLIGAVGTGKTTLVNALVESLDDSVCLAVINHPKMEPVEFLSFVARSFDPNARLNTKADCLHFFKTFLQKAHDEEKSVLLIIDEAHRMSDDLLEEIRLLSNMEQTGTKLIQIFFVGQTELKKRLLAAPCRALRQRITLFYHLQPLSEEETGHYIRHRLSVAGATAIPFTPRAIHTVYRYSGGYPRRINRLCDRALLTGFVKTITTVDAATVHECAREINLIDPLQPAFRQAFRLRLNIWRWWDGEKMRQARVDGGRALTNALKRTRNAVGDVWRFLETTLSRWASLLRDAFTAGGPERRRPVVLAAVAVALIVIAGWFVGHNRQERAQETVTAGEPDTTSDAAHMLAAYRPAPPPALNDKPLPPPEKEARAYRSEPPEPPPVATAQKARTALSNGDFSTAIALLENDRKATLANDKMRTLYATALLGRAGQLKDQSPEKATALLDKAVAAAPDNVDALVQSGNHYTRISDYPRAIDLYTKALARNDQLPDVLFNLGFIYANTGDYHKAEEMLQRVVDLKPAYVDKALFNLAVVQEKIGKPQACLASLEAAVAIRPENAKARAYLQELKANRETVQ